jgi:hypothetical protein
MARLAAAVFGVALVLVACAIDPVEDRPPVPAGPFGPIVPSSVGGPPVECRGVPVGPCADLGSGEDADVVRYIVTCTAVCTLQRGETRIDALLANGQVVSRGAGSYDSSEAEPAPGPGESAPT